MLLQFWHRQKGRRARGGTCAHSIAASDGSRGLKYSKHCPVCGNRREDEAPTTDFVPAEDLSWPGAVCDKSEELPKQALRNESLLRNVEQLVSMISAKKTPISLPSRTLQPGNQPNGRRSGRFTVWRAECTGGQLLGGRINLTESGVLVLTGFGLHFRHTNFTGGAVICFGSEFSGSFRSCSFDSCALYVVHGAIASVSNCKWPTSQIALLAHGRSTTVSIRSCVITARYGAIAEAGAAVVAQDVFLTCATTGIAVLDADSHVSVNGCYIRGKPSAEQPGSGCAWLSMFGGDAAMQRVHVARSMMPAIVSGRTASLELWDSFLEHEMPAGAFFATAAPVPWVAAQAISSDPWSAGARVCMHEVSTTCLPSMLPFVSPEVIAAAEAMADGFPDDPAAAALLGSDLDADALPAQRSVFSLGFRAGLPQRGGAIIAKRCDFRADDMAVLRMDFGARASFAHCVLKGRKAVCVSGDQSSATLSHCDVSAVKTCGVVERPGSSLRVRGGRAQSCEAVFRAGTETILSLADLSISNRVAERQDVSVYPDESALLWVSPGATAYLLRCTLHPGQKGVFVNGGHMTAVDVVMDGEGWLQRQLRVPEDAPEHAYADMSDPDDSAGLVLNLDKPSLGYICISGHMVIRGGSISNVMYSASVHRDPGKPDAGGTALLHMHGVLCNMYTRAVQADCNCALELADCWFLRGGGLLSGRGRPGQDTSMQVPHGAEKWQSAAVTALDAASVHVRGCKFRGNPQDVWLRTREKASIEKCSFQGTVGQRLDTGAVVAAGVCEVVECQFSNVAIAVLASGQGAQCSVRGCQLGSVVAGGLIERFTAERSGRISVVD